VALNLRRLERHLGSFKVVISGHRVGRVDFATGDKSGDRRGADSFASILAAADGAEISG
jgi:hypothetical protein